MSAKPNPADQRHAPRVTIADQPQVVDAHCGDILGQLVNLSTDGLMLASEHRIARDSVFQLQIPLQRANQQVSICVGAESLWSEDANGSGTYWTGFQIIDISPADQLILDAVIID
jgi:hypothetical protein